MEEKGPSKSQFMGKDILKEKKPSIQFHILHSRRSHSYPKGIRGWSYTCFRVFEALQQFGKIAPSVDFYSFAHFYFLNI